jgi:hypothetical protein
VAADDWRADPAQDNTDCEIGDQQKMGVRFGQTGESDYLEQIALSIHQIRNHHQPATSGILETRD